MKTIVGAALFLAAGSASIAQAQVTTAPATGVATVTVSYADLSVDDPDGAKVLDQRIRSAARRVCDEPNRVITHYRVQHLCMKHAVADAWRQVAMQRSMQTANSRSVTLAAAQTGRQP
jgi:UrcA family protein